MQLNICFNHKYILKKKLRLVMNTEQSYIIKVLVEKNKESMLNFFINKYKAD